MSIEQLIKITRTQALEENYRVSIQITEEVLSDLYYNMTMFLQNEQRNDMDGIHTVSIKNITADKDTMTKACATEIVQYLVIKYELGRKK